MEGFSRVTDEYSLAYQLNTNHPPLSILPKLLSNSCVQIYEWSLTFEGKQSIFTIALFFKSVDASVS